MILNLHGEIINSPIDQTPIKENWKDYIEYAKHNRLYSFTKEELHDRIQTVKNRGRSFINSAILIGGFLREISVNDNFHQQFKAAFPSLDSLRILRMQLYILLLEDDDKWTFSESERDEAMLADADYIISMEG